MNGWIDVYIFYLILSIYRIGLFIEKGKKILLDAWRKGSKINKTRSFLLFPDEREQVTRTFTIPHCKRLFYVESRVREQLWYSSVGLYVCISVYSFVARLLASRRARARARALPSVFINKCLGHVPWEKWNGVWRVP